tara:strand:+ start:333 stop:581 length:249 start_codon:yes stop_codon:yes gene_type:complete
VEGIFESFLGGIARGVGYLIGEILFGFVFYYTGALIWKALTFGSFPKRLDQDPFDFPSGIFCTLFGLSLYIGGFVYWAINYG